MNWYKYNINNLTEDDYSIWFSLMSIDKQKRVNAYREPNAKKRSVCGEMLVKTAISNLFNIPANTVKLDRSENGKPYCLNVNVHFNVSHCYDYVVCAIDDKPIGIDIELIKKRDLKVAKRICTEQELMYIFGKEPTDFDYSASNSNATLTKFYEIWTAKEAFLKWNGNGLSGLKNIDYSLVNKYHFAFENYCVCIITSK